jgi:LAO/AO transport system kinase
MGDEIQAIKAGIMEIADIFVVNKADRDGASKLRRELSVLLDMAPANSFAAGWRPPIVMVENAFEPECFCKGMEDLTMAVAAHYKHMADHDLLGSRMRRKATVELREAIRTCVLEPILDRLVCEGDMDAMIERMLKKEADPYTLAEQIAGTCLKEI